MNLAIAKFVSAKKPMEKTGKRQKPGESAAGDRVVGPNLERSLQGTEVLWIWQSVWWPEKELSQWIAKGKKQLPAGQAKRAGWEPFQHASHRASQCTERLLIPWWAVQPLPTITKRYELLANKVFGAAVYACVLCVDGKSLEKTGQVIWHSTQSRLA